MFDVLKFLFKAILFVAGVYILAVIGMAILAAAGIIACIGFVVLALIVSIFIAWKTMGKKSKDGSYEVVGKNYRIKKTVEKNANKEKIETTFKYGNWSGKEIIETDCKFD
jgi:membrane protein implicated in regulation of membrane protease activity